MVREIITESANEVEVMGGKLLINGDNLTIDKVFVSQDDELGSDWSKRDDFLLEVRGSGCVIGEVVVLGIPHGLGCEGIVNAEEWQFSCRSAVKVTGDNNLIGVISAYDVHIPLMVTGENNTVARLNAGTFSGDGFNLCGDGSVISSAVLYGGVNVFPDWLYHTDIGMFYKAGGDGVLSNCAAYNVQYTGEPRQGILSDGLTSGCKVVNLSIEGRLINDEHGVSFADGFGSVVVNNKTCGAVNWQKKAPQGCSEKYRGCVLVGGQS